MSVSSLQLDDFEHIKLNNILVLISVLLDTDLKIISLIKQRYDHDAINFSDTVSFLKNIRIIENDENSIWVKDKFFDELKNSDEMGICNRVLHQIQYTNNLYQKPVFKYLTKFDQTDGEITYRPIENDRGEYSGVRNFLMEFGVVEYDFEFEKYKIPPEHIHFFAFANEKSSKYSPRELKRRLAQKDEVGAAAELVVVQYEKNRIGDKFLKYIEHIAAKNSSAGYDIKSVTIVDGKAVPRYIEVKAVPPDSFRFYWSQNEIRVAKLLKFNYFLYLLPVLRGGDFRLDDMKMIPDPILVILDDVDTWDVKPDVVCCSLKRSL